MFIVTARVVASEGSALVRQQAFIVRKVVHVGPVVSLVRTR